MKIYTYFLLDLAHQILQANFHLTTYGNLHLELKLIHGQNIETSTKLVGLKTFQTHCNHKSQYDYHLKYLNPTEK